MTDSLTVPDSSDVEVSATGPLRHRCPHVGEVDHGSITLRWRVHGATYELHALREYLDGYKDASLSHEEITDVIRDNLSDVEGIELLEVATTWTTAGMEVTCSTSPIRAALTP